MPDSPPALPSAAPPPGPPPVGLPPELSEPGGLRRLLYLSVMRGLCVAIPVPFVDDWAADLLRHRGAKELLLRNGLPTDTKLRETLLHGARGAPGCVSGCLGLLGRIASKLILWPIRRLLRWILFVLLLHDIVRVASRQFHESAALACALDDPDVRHALRYEPVATADLIHRAVRRSCEEVDDAVLRKALLHSLRTSRRVLESVLRAFKAAIRRSRQAGREASAQTLEAAPDHAPGRDALRAANRAAATDAMPEDLEAEAPGLYGVLQEVVQALLIQEDYLQRIHSSVLGALAAELQARPPLRGDRAQ